MMRFLSRVREDDRGHTLAEMLVVVALMGSVIGTMYLVVTTASSWASHVEARSIAAREMRLTADQMGRDLRQAGEIDTGQGAFAEASARRCSFYVDLDHDGTPDKVTYYVDGSKVKRTVASATIPVAPYNFGPDGPPTTLIGTLQTGWTGTIFTYLDTADPPNAVTSLPAISTVKIHIINQASSGPETAVVDSTTWIKVRSVHNSISMRPIKGSCHG